MSGFYNWNWMSLGEPIILDKREMPRCNWYPICNAFHLAPEETSMIVISENGAKYLGPLRKEDENNEKV